MRAFNKISRKEHVALSNTLQKYAMHEFSHDDFDRWKHNLQIEQIIKNCLFD